MSGRCVLVDLDAVGSLRRSPRVGGSDVVRAYPDAVDALRGLAADGVRVGVLPGPGGASATDLGALVDGSALAGVVDPDLLVGGTEPDAVTAAVGAAGDARCVVVSADRVRRALAIDAGAAATPHLRLADAVLAGEALRYAVVEGVVWPEQLDALPIVALRAPGDGVDGWLALASAGTFLRAPDLGVAVLPLGREDQPAATEAYLLRGELGPDPEADLLTTDTGRILALDAAHRIEDRHPRAARHGHTDKLAPARVLAPGARALDALAPPGPRAPEAGDATAAASITEAELQADLLRYTGAKAIDDAGTHVVSRHVEHTGNALAVRALVEDLTGILGSATAVTLHPFLHEGRALDNVEAEIPGAPGGGVVLVTAHLDSTAQSSPAWVPAVDPAPGADDDGSGVVAVLAIARVVAAVALRTPLRRTVRFVLFNAEEHGLVGSAAYARDQAALGVPITAVFQIDMMGYNHRPPMSYEVHAGFRPDPGVEEASRALAEQIAVAAAVTSADLPAPEVYSSATAGGDPADGRSDHTSFQEVGYPACVVTEDFFAGPGPGPADANPHYHTTQDDEVDIAYTARIARGLCAAALTAAR